MLNRYKITKSVTARIKEVLQKENRSRICLLDSIKIPNGSQKYGKITKTIF
jgi:hypothetical protein